MPLVIIMKTSSKLSSSSANEWTDSASIELDRVSRYARRTRTAALISPNCAARVAGIDEEFETQSGFISRGGVGRASATHRYTLFGERGSRVESFTTELVLDGAWKYDRFVNGKDALEKKLHLNASASLRGGWSAGASVLVEEFGFDPDLYAGYMVEVERPDGTVEAVPFTGTPRLPNLDWVLTLDQRHLERVLREYVAHYNLARPHQALGLRAPMARGQPSLPIGEIVRRDRVAGLVHEYDREAA